MHFQAIISVSKHSISFRVNVLVKKHVEINKAGWNFCRLRGKKTFVDGGIRIEYFGYCRYCVVSLLF